MPYHNERASRVWDLVQAVFLCGGMPHEEAINYLCDKWQVEERTARGYIRNALRCGLLRWARMAKQTLEPPGRNAILEATDKARDRPIRIETPRLTIDQFGQGGSGNNPATESGERGSIGHLPRF